MTYNITLTANHQSLTAEYLPLAAESVQYLTAKVVCETEDWTGREIKAMFGQGCTVHEITVTDGEITAKQQLNLTAGDWCVWLVGNSARDGDVIPRITTNIAHISVAPTGGTEGNPFPNTPPTAEEQLRADMGNLSDLTTKDKSSLVAAINETAEGGSKDAVKYTAQSLTDEQQTQARENIGAEKAGTGYTKAEIDGMNEYTGALIDGLSTEVDNLDKAVDQRYTKPAGGIPKSDLAQDVQTSLAKADAAISLGLTSAAPGQIIKVKTVDADGKPTEWEAAEMAGGGGEDGLIAHYTVPPDSQLISWEQAVPGIATLEHVYVIIIAPAQAINVTVRGGFILGSKKQWFFYSVVQASGKRLYAAIEMQKRVGDIVECTSIATTIDDTANMYGIAPAIYSFRRDILGQGIDAGSLSGIALTMQNTTTEYLDGTEVYVYGH